MVESNYVVRSGRLDHARLVDGVGAGRCPTTDQKQDAILVYLREHDDGSGQVSLTLTELAQTFRISSARAQLLEARGNLQRMLAQIPLTDDERAAVEDGTAAVERLHCLPARFSEVPSTLASAQTSLARSFSRARFAQLRRPERLSGRAAADRGARRPGGAGRRRA